ncbi:hypothetical protein TNCV_1510651 [Trichonephila clavipes]|nr:hypothetical protein TNCV_1510651 [Trichonephila clavipes]
MRSTKDQLVEKDVLMPVKHNVFLWNLPDVEESLSVPFFLYVSDSPLVSMEVPLRTAYGQNGRCGMQPKAKHKSSRAGAAKTRTETCEIVEEKQKLLDIREKGERESFDLYQNNYQTPILQLEKACIYMKNNYAFRFYMKSGCVNIPPSSLLMDMFGRRSLPNPAAA